MSCVPFALLHASHAMREITHAIIHANGARDNVLDLQWDMLSVTIGTLPSPLLQQVRFDLIAEKRALLVCYSLDFGLLQLLKIELDQFLTDGADGTEAPETLHPGEHIADFVFSREGGSQPFFLRRLSAKTRLTVSGVPASSVAAYCSTSSQRPGDVLPAMREFSSKHHLTGLIVDQRQPWSCCCQGQS